MLILGVDVETTGLDPNKEEITEIGAVLWDTEFAAPVKFFNHLLKPSCELPEKVQKLTGITPRLLDEHHSDPLYVAQELDNLIHKCDYVAAHNAKFDRAFITVFLHKQLGVTLRDVPWIDSQYDIPYAEEITTRKLTHLAAEHGFVNPFAHRAVTDVLTMLQVCSQYNWSEVVTLAAAPTMTIRAKVTFEEKDKARSTGFRWNGDSKVWLKDIKTFQYDTELAKAREAGFEIGEWR